MTSSYNQIVKDFQKREFANVYLFYGEEPFYIDELSDYLTEHVLSDIEKEFNQVVLYGRDSTAAIVVNSSKQFPMIGDNQLVVLREAQDLDIKKDENLSMLISYVGNPQKSTTLIICYKYKTVPAKLLKAVVSSNQAMAVESKRKGDTEMPVWISNQVKNSGYLISDKAVSMLGEFLGNNLEKIKNELGKLYINIPKGKLITEDIIEKYIGVSKDYNIFEFQRAIAAKDVKKVNLIANHYILNPAENSIFKILPMLLIYFSKILIIHSMKDKSDANLYNKLKISYKTKDEYLSACKNYDAQKVMKMISWLRECNVRALGIDNYSTDQGELLRELVFKILHTP